MGEFKKCMVVVLIHNEHFITHFKRIAKIVVSLSCPQHRSNTLRADKLYNKHDKRYK